MAITREQAYAALASLNPAPVFLDSYRVKLLPADVDIYFGPPEEFFMQSGSHEAYTRNRFVPILDDGNFGIVTFLDPDTRELVQMDVESPGELLAVFRHWQQYLADLMIRIAESGEDDDRVRRIGELLGFAHLDELFDFFTHAAALSGDAYMEARRLFTLSIREG